MNSTKAVKHAFTRLNFSMHSGQTRENHVNINAEQS